MPLHEIRTLQVGSTVELFNFDPTQVEALRNLQLLSTIYQCLVCKTGRNSWQPELASRWQIDRRQMTFTFWIRESFFHDGRIVKGQDVANSISRHLWPRSGSMVKAKLTSLILGAEGLKEGDTPAGISCDVVDNSITLSLTRPCPDFLDILSSPSLAVVGHSATNTDEFVGSGPLIPRLTSSQGDMSFVRHQPYSGSRLVAPMEVTLYEDVNLLEAAILSGEVNLAIGERTSSLLDNDEIPRTALDDPKISFLLLNENHSLLNEISFRHDFFHLCQSLASVVAANLAGVQQLSRYLPAGVLPDNDDQQSGPDISADEFVLKWKTKLEQYPLRIVMTPNRGSISELLALLVIRLQDAGYTPELRMTETKDEVYALLAAGDFDVVPRGWSSEKEDIDGFLQALRHRGPQSPADSDFNHAFEKAAAASTILDEQQRLLAYESLMTELEGAFHFVPLFEELRYIAHQDGMHLNQQMLYPFDIVESSSPC